MIASRNPVPARPWLPGVNVWRHRNGREAHLADIATAAEGRALLQEVDATILAIEDQIDHRGDDDPDWLDRAQAALKKTRRMRPGFERRIAELRRAEDDGVPTLPTATKMARLARAEQRRAAFINAAEELLDREVFVEVWARARELRPSAFAEGGQS